MIVNSAGELFTSKIFFSEFDALAADEARRRFCDLQDKGIIKKNCVFDDMSWFTTDEYSNIGLHFKFNEFEYKPYEEILDFDLIVFIEYLKAFILSLFGEIALETIRMFLLDIRHIISIPPRSVYGNNSNLKLIQPRQCERFFSSLPADSEVLEQLISGVAA